MLNLGDIRVGKTIHFMWNSNGSSGQSITRATNGTVSVYKDASTTESASGVTDTEDFDSRTGVHHVAIDTSADGTFYSAGSDFMVVLHGATIDGQTVNAVIAQFSIENRSALMPTTDGRKLDVSAGGEGGVDWANVGSPTTVNDLSGTTVKAVTDMTTANVIQISGDSAAADNAEAFFDGTGYAGTNNVIPSVTTVTTTTNVTNGVTLANDAITSAKIDASAGTEIANAVLDQASTAEGYTLRELLRLFFSALCGKLSGAATTTVAIRDAADTKDRITMTVDADGNRSAPVLDAT